MTRFSQVTAALRRKSLGQYALLTLCCFVSVLLITAYASMMGSPTVLSVFPEGGDSRKQMTMIFVLAVLGCGVFTTYASGLFFRHKSRDVGILLALGASKDQLRRVLAGELALMSLSACALGALLGALYDKSGATWRPAGHPAGLVHLAGVPAPAGGLRGDGPGL